jgi:hypothetical protein
LFIAETQLSKDGAVVLALKGGLTKRFEFLAREAPRAAGQAVAAAVAVGDLLNRIPIFGPGRPLLAFARMTR